MRLTCSKAGVGTCAVQWSCHSPCVAIEHLKCDWSELRCAVRIRHGVGAGEECKLSNNFYIDMVNMIIFDMFN